MPIVSSLAFLIPVSNKAKMYITQNIFLIIHHVLNVVIALTLETVVLFSTSLEEFDSFIVALGLC